MKAGGCAVLVVDDDEGIRESLCELLADEGYGAIGVANGQEALRYLRAKPTPCLILLDLMMPVMDGWELHRHLKADPRLAALPIIVITAADGDSARSLHAVEVMPKPLPLERILDAVGHHC
jgi:CheY-like chemotaxis protein